MVLCGGASDTALLRQVVALAGGRAGGRAGADGPSAVMVDLAWASRPPAPDERRDALGRLTDAGAVHVADAGIADREDAHSPEVCRRLAAADLVWFAGGDYGALYDRLWATPALDAIRHAHERGAVVGGFSAGATVWGAGALSSFASDDEPEPFPLFGWLDDLVIFAHYFPVREGEFRARVAAFPGCRGLGLAHGGAVVVGPEGELVSLRAGSDGSRNVVLSRPTSPSWCCDGT
jgi:cyanophycinase